MNCILPGFIKSPMSDKIPEQMQQAIISQIPLKRKGTAKEIAEVVDFLISQKSSYITGSSINVNGGAWMG